MEAKTNEEFFNVSALIDERFFEEGRGRKRKKVRVGEGKFLTFVFFFRK